MPRIVRRDRTRQQQLVHGPIDLPFLGLVLLLLAIGLIVLLSASSYYASQYARYNYDGAYFFKRQLIFALLGLAVMFALTRVDYRRWRGFAPYVLMVSIGLLLAVLIPGVGISLNNATRWLKLGVQFQPSEVAKIGVVFYTASVMSRPPKDYAEAMKRHYYPPVQICRKFYYWSGMANFIRPVLALLVVLVLLFLEPHLSAMILVTIAVASILFVSGARLFWFLGGAVLCGGAVWYILTVIGYNGARIQTWQNPWWDPTDASYQVLQSIYAVASGGLTGQGLGLSRQKYLFLPEPEFVVFFSVVCEELGFIGAVMIILLFILLIFRGYYLALHARDRFGSLLIVGFTSILAVQVFLNIAVVINLIPATGVSLPFFSYGGTALMIQLAEVGMILAVSRQIPGPSQEE